jgi:hypothetical protein
MVNAPRSGRIFVLRRNDGVSARLQLFNACAPAGRTGGLFAAFDRGSIRVPLGIPPEGRCDVRGSPPSYGVGPLVKLPRPR